PSGDAPSPCNRPIGVQMSRKPIILLVLAALPVTGASVAPAQTASAGSAGEPSHHRARARPADADRGARTPTRHVVVIFQENVSFDHYFGTYPNATNPSGEPRFVAAPGTPTVNGLTGLLLT